MDTNETEAQVEPVEEEVEEDLEPTTETTNWEERAKKLEEKAIIQRERTRRMNAEIAKLKAAQAPKESKEPSPKGKTGELDETQLDYLDLKGISETEDIDVIEKIVAKTGMTVRQALKDDYVVKKLEANRQARELKDATPSSTKRGQGGQATDLALAMAKFEQTGQLPDDFELASQVVNAMEKKTSTNQPSWRSK